MEPGNSWMLSQRCRLGQTVVSNGVRLRPMARTPSQTPRHNTHPRRAPFQGQEAWRTDLRGVGDRQRRCPASCHGRQRLRSPRPPALSRAVPAPGADQESGTAWSTQHLSPAFQSRPGCATSRISHTCPAHLLGTCYVAGTELAT